MTQELKDKVDIWFTRNWNHYLNEVRTNITKGIMSGYTDDICSFMYTEFLKQDPERIEQMLNDDKVLNWLLRGTSLQIRSKTSPFYSKYRKKRAGAVPTYFIEESYDPNQETLDEMYQCVMDALEDESIDWYLRKILKMKYIEGLTYAEITEKYGIHNHSMRKHINEAIDAIRNACKEYDN